MSGPLVKSFANLGVRAPNMDAELEFLAAFGASDVHRTERMSGGARVERVHLQLGATKLTLFRRATYDDALDALGAPRGGGIGHVAFAIEDTSAVVRALAAQGIAPLIPTFKVDASASGPERLITYFRSPNGTVIETQETIDKKAPA